MPKLNQRDFNDEPVKYVTEKHVACVFLLDTSSSMNSNEAIKQLNEGLRVSSSRPYQVLIPMQRLVLMWLLLRSTVMSR